EGGVRAVGAGADRRSRVFDIEVTIPNADGRLRPGMIGTVVLRASGSEVASSGTPLLTVPLTAVVRDAGAAESGAERHGGPSGSAVGYGRNYALFLVQRPGGTAVVPRPHVQ